MLPSEANVIGARQWSATVARAIPFLIAFFVWWFVTSPAVGLPRYVLPSPGQVLARLIELTATGLMLEAVVASVQRMLLGFVLGSACGITLAILVGTNASIAAFFMPLAKFFQTIAGPIWIPLAVLWLGLGWRTVTFIIFNTVFFLVFYNTLIGIQTVQRNFIRAILTMGGGRWHVIREVLIPGAVPGMLVGLRVGIGYGWRSLIAAEIVASGAGLGVFIWDGQRFFRVSDVILGLLVIGLISVAMDRFFLQPLEARTAERWGLMTREAL